MTNIVTADAPAIFTGLYDLLLQFCVPLLAMYLGLWGVKVLIKSFKRGMGM